MSSEVIPEPVENCKIRMRDSSTNSERILDNISLEYNRNLQSPVINIGS